MDKVVAKLSEIEAAAVSIITNTETQKKKYEQKIQKEKEIFDATLSEQTNKTIQTIRKEFQTTLDNELASLKSNNELALAAFQQEYDQHHESYAAQIIKRITEV